MLLIKVSFVEKIRVQAEYIFNAAAVWNVQRRMIAPQILSFLLSLFHVFIFRFVEEYLFFHAEPRFSVFISILILFCPFLLLPQRRVSQPCIPIQNTLLHVCLPTFKSHQCYIILHTHTHADTSCCGSHAKNFLLTEFLLPLLSALLFAQSSQHSRFWCDPSNRKAFSVYQNTLEEHRELFTWYTSKKVQQDVMFVSRQIYLTVLYGPKRNIKIWRNIYIIYDAFFFHLKDWRSSVLLVFHFIMMQYLSCWWLVLNFRSLHAVQYDDGGDGTGGESRDHMITWWVWTSEQTNSSS